MRAPRAGDLRIPVTIQRIKASTTRDAYGQLDLADAANWETYCARRCRIDSQSGDESLSEHQMAARITHQVTLRADSQTVLIRPSDRVLWASRTLEVVTRHTSGARQEWVIVLCREPQ